MLALTDSALAPLCHLRHGHRPDRRRALELLAASHDGATEALMLAYGFTVEDMVALVSGLATGTAERMVAGGRSVEVARARITEEDGGRWQRCIAHARFRIAESIIDAAPGKSDD